MMGLVGYFREHRSRIVALGLALGVLVTLPLLGSRQHLGVSLSWVSLLPPVVALGAVLVTGNVIASLALAVVVGAGAEHGPMLAVPRAFERYLWSNLTDPWHLYICGFALCVLGTIKIVERSGGAGGMVQLLARRLNSARSTKLGTGVAGLLVFFDDYANTLLIGSSLRAVADRYGVSREKLAYLVDSTAAPVAGLAVVSTWLSYEIGLLEEILRPLGVEQSGYSVLLTALPFRFYCLFALLLVFISSAWEFEVGPMLEAERRAHRASVEHRITEDTALNDSPNRSALNALLPVGVLLFLVFAGFVYDGGGFVSPAPFSLDYWHQTLAGVEHGEVVLFGSACASGVVAGACSILTGSLSPRQSLDAFGVGLRTGATPLAILVCAWGLGGVSKDLGTGPFLVATLHGNVPPPLLPLLTCLASGSVAFATGTSWGTMAIVLPAALPLAFHVGGMQLAIPTIAAVLDGAIFGDHCSPVSDTTVLSSTACECDVLAHVWTQLPYALLAMAAAAFAYLTTGLGWLGPLPALLGGTLLMSATLRIFGRRPRETTGRPSPRLNARL
jgi:Na+/H+ antiporter NhaC